MFGLPFFGAHTKYSTITARAAQSMLDIYMALFCFSARMVNNLGYFEKFPTLIVTAGYLSVDTFFFMR